MLGLEAHGDQAVKVVGRDVVSGASVILFNNVLRAVYVPPFEAVIGDSKANVIRQTSSGGLVLEAVWTACSRWSQVLQQDGILGLGRELVCVRSPNDGGEKLTECAPAVQ